MIRIHDYSIKNAGSCVAAFVGVGSMVDCCNYVFVSARCTEESHRQVAEFWTLQHVLTWTQKYKRSQSRNRPTWDPEACPSWQASASGSKTLKKPLCACVFSTARRSYSYDASLKSGTRLLSQKGRDSRRSFIFISSHWLLARAYQWSTSVTSDWIMDRRNDF